MEPTPLQRLKAIWELVSGLFPLTPGGVLLLGLSLWAVVGFGWSQVDLVLLVVGGVGLLAGGASVFVGSGLALFLWLDLKDRRTKDPLHLECSYAGRTGFELPTFWFLPLAAVEWSWVSPQVDVRLVRRWGQVIEQVTPLRRGDFDAIKRRIVVSDVFGAVRISFVVTEAREVRFVPTRGGLRDVRVVQGMAGGDQFAHPEGPPMGDRYDMRRYSAGDPIRFVLWKVFARSRQLMVRTPEQSLAPVRQTVAFLVAGAHDEPAAGATRVAIEHGALGEDWILGVDGTGQLAQSRKHAMDLIVASARVRPENSGGGLAHFLSTAAPGGVRRAVIFVPAVPGPWMDRVLAATAAVASTGAPMEFIVCTDGVDRTGPASWVWRLFFVSRKPKAGEKTPSAAADVAAVVRRLASSRSRVIVVDRLAGRVFHAAQLKSLGVAA